ncbi:MAG: prepilin-type N-terminal cleavage/methylation domain-containing protein [Pseudomonadota bacterium]
MARHGRSQRGFTLLEIMIVVVIVAILAAVVGPNLFAGNNRGKDFEREADMLAARVRVAQDDAMLYGHEYGIVFSETGYRFVVWEASKNRFVSASGPDYAWTLRDLEHEVRISTSPDGKDPILVTPSPSPSPSPEEEQDAAAADAAASPEEKEPDWQPSVFVLSSGEVTPFTALFSAEGEDTALELRIDALGNRVQEREAPAGTTDAG